MESEIFAEMLRVNWPELSREQVKRLVRFRELVVAESELQNLTRLLEPKAFLEGHLEDVRALLRCGLVEYPAMDLGSGVGVPGLAAAIVSGDRWVLAESEGRKAGFLRRIIAELGLDSHVEIFAGRGEEYLAKQGRVSSVVARAVGTVDRIYSWLRPCSTWNNLILLKGPKWSEEKELFRSGKFGGELIESGSYSYSVGSDAKSLRIVRMDRVPRGTKGLSSG